MQNLDPLIEEAYGHALDILRRCVTPHGFRASGLLPGYPQVWARDSIITGLGAVLTGETELVAAYRASLDTLGEHQSPLGLIPLNVHPESGECSTENAGAVDANLWFILGHYYHYLRTGDLAYLRANWQRLELATLWLRYQDMNECGLLEVPEAGDWMDLLAVRYNVLYDNVLYGAALKAMVAWPRRAVKMASEHPRPRRFCSLRRAAGPMCSSGSTCCCGSTAAGCRRTSPSTWNG